MKPKGGTTKSQTRHFSPELILSAEIDSATDGGLGAEKLQEAKLLVRQDVGERPENLKSKQKLEE